MKPLYWDAYSDMNKTEVAYAKQLNLLQSAGQIVSWMFEPIKFVLSHNVEGKRNATTYTIDFMVVMKDKFVFVEVKTKRGKWTSMRDDARVKINMVAEMFPWFEFRVAYYEKGRFTEKGV